MPSYSYKAAKRDGSIVAGSVESSSPDSVKRDLRSQGLVVISVSDDQTVRKSSGGGRFGSEQVLAFTSELSVLLRAGLPIDRALKVQIEMCANDKARQILEGILATVKGGKGLSQALAEHPAQFDDFYVSMIRSGEASGNLAEILNRLAEQLERAKQVRSGVISALIYPAILAVVATISVLVMLGFVVPQFEALFADMGQGLPFITELVINGGEVVEGYGWIILIVVALAVVAGRKWFRTEPGKQWLDDRMLRLPILGGVVFKYEVSRFSRTLGTLQNSGVSLLQALQIAVATVGNGQVRGALDGLIPEVKRGGRVSHCLAESKVFSPMVIQMVRVGEESGQLGDMMLELARIYDDEVSSGIKRSLTLLEPVLILGMGGMIGFIIVAILMGILSVNDLAI